MQNPAVCAVASHGVTSAAMRIRVPALLFVAACSISAFAQQTPAVSQRVALGYTTIQEGTLRADLTFLASDQLQGRLSLTNGDETAVQWIAAEFAKAGVKPAFGNSYLQAVPLVEYRNDRAQSYVSLSRSAAEKKWQFPEAF